MKNKGLLKISLICLTIVGISLPGIYFVHTKFPENMVQTPEFSKGTLNSIKDNLNVVPTVEPSPLTNVKNIDKYEIDADIKDYANPTNKELYKILYDAIDEVKAEVDVSNFTIDDNELENLTRALWYQANSQFFYIKNIQFNKESNKFKLSYTYDKEKVKEMKKAFNEKVNYILNEVVKPNSSELEKELAIYKYITQNSSYNYENNSSVDDINAYSVIVNGKGICLGYANSMKYLLNKAGIVCHTVDSDEIAHIWNIVKIDDVYYQLDATWEVNSAGTELKFFNFTDEERRQNSSYQVWYGGNRNYKRSILPKCTTNKFDFVRAMKYYSLDDGWFYYGNLNDNNKLYKVKADGTTNQKVHDDPIGSIASVGDYIYYSNSSDNNYLYKINKDGTNKVMVDNTIENCE